ncbi:MAG: amino acid adenylation domain-containing protein, partial [Candidatus Electrothrix sp.]
GNSALIFADSKLSYQDVNKQANLLAHHLLSLEQSGDTTASPLVAILLDRSPEMVIAVLAALKSGRAYVPIDPNYPPERIQRIVESSNAAFLLTRSYLLTDLSLEEAAPNCQAVCFDTIDLSASSVENPTVPCSAEELAYVIFTSGSTGQPKGVMINHLGAVNTIQDINQRFHVTEQDRVLALSSLSFDLSVYDIFGLLSIGGAVVIPEPELDKDPGYWVELMERHQVTLWNTVPALMGLLTDYLAFHPEAAPAALRLVMMSGDWIPLTLPDRIRELWTDTQVISLGGATEASIWSIWFPIDQVDPRWKSIPYGRALRNQAVYVLDEQMNICSASVPGHLYIGGIGVAMGYWRDEERTAASFITHPLTGERLYRTGDLGVYLPDGNIEFIGREDTQVKIRGFRIELGEVEAALQRHPDVGAAAVKVFGSGENRSLAAYFTEQIKENSSEGKGGGEGQEQDHEALLEQWQEIFDETYSESAAANTDRGFNIVGWNSSYSGLPIPATEMKEWLDGTLEEIRSLAPKRVLEIGCGTGMLLFRIAPHCEHYTGLDISQKALHSIEEQISDWESSAKITLMQGAADNLAGIEPASADTVIINSVIQYFPSVHYLLTVLTGAIEAVAPGGSLFIGDVRNFQLFEAFHNSVQFEQADDALSLVELKQRIAQALLNERELLV